MVLYNTIVSSELDVRAMLDENMLDRPDSWSEMHSPKRGRDFSRNLMIAEISGDR